MSLRVQRLLFLRRHNSSSLWSGLSGRGGMTLLDDTSRLSQPLHFFLVPIVVELGHPVLVDSVNSFGPRLSINFPDELINVI